MEIKWLRLRGINFPTLDKSHVSSNINDENGLNICIYLLGQHWLDGRARKDVGECEYLYSESDSVKPDPVFLYFHSHHGSSHLP